MSIHISEIQLIKDIKKLSKRFKKYEATSKKLIKNSKLYIILEFYSFCALKIPFMVRLTPLACQTQTGLFLPK